MVAARVLVTGGLGFIGSALVRLLLAGRPDRTVVNLDLVTYAANPANLRDVEQDPRYVFVRGDVADAALVRRVFVEYAIQATVHCAAETHVDRSIADARPFLRTNVDGTQVLLEAARTAGARHVQVSTDEVYGSLGPDDPPFTERTPLAPRSPYGASKAAGDLLALAERATYGTDVVVTRCSNNYGPRQHPEKLIPLCVTAALTGRSVPVYGDGRQRRDWLFVEDHARGLLAALERGAPGGVYNFGGGAERENLDVVRAAVRAAGASAGLIRHVADRPGHDRRYAMAYDRAHAELGWSPDHTFEAGLAATVAWYRGNPDWWAASAVAAHEASRRRIERWADDAGAGASTLAPGVDPAAGG
jgi:dTDP-glucose 4,6-dehydratase